MKKTAKASSATALLATAALTGIAAGSLHAANATGGVKTAANIHAGIAALDAASGSNDKGKSSCASCNAPAPSK